MAFDQRTGFKVKGRKLVLDGEQPIWTTRGNADQEHPQKYVRVPGPDNTSYRPGPPAMHSIGAIVDCSWVVASDTHPQNEGDTQQGIGVLRRLAAPALSLYLDPSVTRAEELVF